MSKNQLDPYSPGGCFIATACYGSEFTVQILLLKEFRDSILKEFKIGRKFIQLYYKYSPSVVDFLKHNNFLRTLTRLLVVEPSYIISRILLWRRKTDN